MQAHPITPAPPASTTPATAHVVNAATALRRGDNDAARVALVELSHLGIRLVLASDLDGEGGAA